MFTQFFGKTKTQEEKTRFEDCKELVALIPILNKLRDKKHELQAEADAKGSSSVAFSKLSIVEQILLHFDLCISRFNRAPKQKYQENEIEDILNLINYFCLVITEVNSSRATLNQQRSPNKQTANALVNYGFRVGTITFAVTNSYTLVGALAALWLSREASFLTRAVTGLREKDAETYKLVLELDSVLKKMQTNLCDYLNRLRMPAALIRNSLQKSWGAIALTTHPIFNNLPKDIKTEILSYIKSGYETERPSYKTWQHDRNIINAAENMCASHFKKK